jgi:CheY-like chemotaxis protein
MTILVIDDARAIRALLRAALGRCAGMHVVEAASGPEGVEAAQRHQPDLILLDVNMPGMDGRQTLAALRADDRTAGIPVIFLTAEEREAEHALLRALGVRDILPKAFDPLLLSGRLLAAMAEV